MLRPSYLASAADGVVEIWDTVEADISSDIARRIVKAGRVTETAAWQMEKAKELGMMQGDITKALSKATNLSEKELRRLIAEACQKALSFDDAIYRAAGLAPLGLSQSPALSAVLLQGTNNLMTLIGNYTKTTARMSELAFTNIMDRAFLQTISGAFDYTTAIRMAVKDIARQGIAQIAYPTGAVSSVENAVRRAAITGVNQAISKLQLARAEEMGCNLVEVTSHAGARPSHAQWQGQVYCIRGKHGRYKDFYQTTGYGTGDGLCGWNCYHNFYPFFEGLSTRAFSKDPAADMGLDNDTLYEQQQMQRALERRIRQSKKECATIDAAVQSADGELKGKLQEDFEAASAKLKRRESALEEYLKKTGRMRQRERESTAGFGHSQSSKAVHASKRYEKKLAEREKYDKMVAEIKSAGNLPAPAKVHIPPQEIDVHSLSFDDAHINAQRGHNVTREQADAWIQNAKMSVTVWGGKFERYYGPDGCVYVGTKAQNIRTAFSPEEFDSHVKAIMEALNKYGLL